MKSFTKNPVLVSQPPSILGFSRVLGCHLAVRWASALDVSIGSLLSKVCSALHVLFFIFWFWVRTTMLLNPPVCYIIFQSVTEQLVSKLDSIWRLGGLLSSAASSARDPETPNPDHKGYLSVLDPGFQLRLEIEPSCSRHWT